MLYVFGRGEVKGYSHEKNYFKKNKIKKIISKIFQKKKIPLHHASYVIILHLVV